MCVRAGASLCVAVLGAYVSGIIPPRRCSRCGCNSVFRAMCFLQMFHSWNYWFPVCFSDITWCPFKTHRYPTRGGEKGTQSASPIKAKYSVECMFLFRGSRDLRHRCAINTVYGLGVITNTIRIIKISPHCLYNSSL